MTTYPEPIFRAWDKLNQIMMSNTFYGSIPDTMKMFYSHDWEQMQYVGEKDLHDKKIFTSDIIGFIFENPFQKTAIIGIVQRVGHIFTTKNYVIESVCYLDPEHKKTREYIGMEYVNLLNYINTPDCFIEIIGNTYENSIKEILKKYGFEQKQNARKKRQEI